MTAAAACVTVNVWPPIVMFAVRDAESGFAATVKLTKAVPVALPGMPVIHEGTPLLVHAHADVVLTSNELVPPAAVALWLVGFSEKVHANAACETVNVWLPMRMSAERGDGFELAATVKLIV